MKKIALAVLVAAFGYTCAVAQTPEGRLGKNIRENQQGSVIGAHQQSTGQTAPIRNNSHIKYYHGKKPIVAKCANNPKPLRAYPSPRPHPGKGHAYGHVKHYNGQGHNHHHCQKPANTLNLLPQQQQQQPSRPQNPMKAPVVIKR